MPARPPLGLFFNPPDELDPMARLRAQVESRFGPWALDRLGLGSLARGDGQGAPSSWTQESASDLPGGRASDALSDPLLSHAPDGEDGSWPPGPDEAEASSAPDDLRPPSDRPQTAGPSGGFGGRPLGGSAAPFDAALAGYADDGQGWTRDGRAEGDMDADAPDQGADAPFMALGDLAGDAALGALPTPPGATLGSSDRGGPAATSSLPPALAHAALLARFKRPAVQVASVAGSRSQPPGLANPPLSGRGQIPNATAFRPGALSEHLESNGKPGVVSTGKGDHGGVSYGAYQIKQDNVRGFVGHEGSRWSELQGKAPRSAELAAAWKSVAARDPAGFKAAQRDYIDRTHYRPQLARVRHETGLDIGARSQALQDVVWSTAVQHGPNASIVSNAIGRLKAQGVRPDDRRFDGALINAIYDERGRRGADGELVHFRKNSAKVKRGVAERFPRERNRALAELARQSR